MERLQIFYSNVRGLLSKLNQIRVIASCDKPDFIMITETWINDNISNKEIYIDNYQILSRYDRADTSAGIGGGLLIYAKTSLTVCEVQNSCNFNQYIHVKVKNEENVCDTNLYLVYRPHKLYNCDNVKLNNENLTNLLSSANGHSIFIGDFNYRDIDWNNCTARGDQAKLFLDAVNDNFFTQMVNFPTHSSGSTLDLVLTSNANLITDIEDCGFIGKSDHKAIKIEVMTGVKQKDKPKFVDDWSNADLETMKTVLRNVNWHENFSHLSTEEAWNNFKNVLSNLKEKYVPKKQLNKTRNPQWFDKETAVFYKRKKRLWRKYKASNNLNDYARYEEAEKKLKNKIRNSKKNFERRLAGESSKNPKKFYSYMKSKTSNKESVGPLKDDSGNEITEEIEMARTLNSFFGSVFTEENTENIPNPEPVHVGAGMTDVTFTTEKVKVKINKLKPFSAPGPDGITARTLITFVDELSLPLSLLFQKSYDTGETPSDWKKANVTPIFKKGKKCKASNYRPVSLTSIVCKLMESIIKDDMTEYLESNKIIKNSQHGFRKRRSCLSNLLEYLENLTKAVDSGQKIDMVYLDFSKAFDKVPIKRLLLKIRAAGINEKIVKWIANWLDERMQRVVLNGEASEWILVLSGVPQGSVLGPLLFIIFINDLDQSVDVTNSILFKFADDTKCGKIIVNEESTAELQKDLDNLLVWADTWQMQFNPDKCKVLHFGRNNAISHYTMNGYAPSGTVLENATEEKDVGVWISNSLKPSVQCQKAANRANSILGQMSRAVSYRDRVTWIKLYKQYVRPHLEYCVQAWSPWLEQDKKIIEKVQEKAVKMVSGLRGNSYEARLKELKLQSLEDRRVRGDMIQVWKILSSYDNISAETFFLKFEQTVHHTRLGANDLNLKKPRFNSDIRKNFFSIRVIDKWNSLPHQIKSASNLNLFKNLYDRWIWREM